jgi:hypothetical protein
MKKLILVTLTAFAASWLLSEARRDDFSKPTRPKVYQPSLVVQDSSDDSGAIRTTPWKKGPGPRSKRGPAPTQAQAPAPAALPKTPPPSWFPKTELEEEASAKTDAFGFRVIVGRVSVSEDRAKLDLRESVERAVSDWIAADVPPSWKVPPEVLDAMVEGAYTQEVTRNLIAPEAKPSSETPGLDGLYTLYRAGQKLNFSPDRHARIVGMYHQVLATQRMQKLGGGLALALVTLAVLSGYIKADEATKGYYTNRLRLVASAGLGVAGAVAYRFLV